MMLEEILKSFNNSLCKKFPSKLPLFKATSTDESQGLIYGVFSVANIEDLEGDIIPNEELEKMAHSALLNLANGDFTIKGGKEGTTHLEDLEAFLVESYVDKTEENWAWKGAILILDEVVKADAEAGIFEGFSAGGEVYKEEI